VGQLSEAATVTIDGTSATVDAAHSFGGVKQLTSGTNTFHVAATDASGNTQTKSYEVDASGANRTFTHDANGNMTGDGNRTFEWDAVNRLIAVVIGTHRSEFTYDGLGRRVRIVEKENGATVRDANLFWAKTEIIEERLTTGEVNRFFADGEQHNGVARYVTRDHLGSIREVTNTAGIVVTRNDYDPYGRLTRIAGTEDSRFGSTGHFVHAESGLVLTLNRTYDAAIGRWLVADPSGMIDGPNLYGYVGNNPTNYLDPLGLQKAPPKGPPPIPAPPAKDGSPNEWVEKPGSGNRPKWGPEKPVQTPGGKGGQPGASPDPGGHWDVDHGDGNRSRWKPNGKPDPEPHGPGRRNPKFVLPWWIPRMPSFPIIVNPCLLNPMLPGCTPGSCGGPA
jgi:RHS repeat-associated protein